MQPEDCGMYQNADAPAHIVAGGLDGAQPLSKGEEVDCPCNQLVAQLVNLVQ